MIHSIKNISNERLHYVGLLVFLLTAIFSVGYFHPDEHFQLLEFANYKLGFSPANDLPWEFSEQIRPTAQASMAYCLFKLMHSIGLSNPFYQTIILRLLTAVLAWFIYSKTISVLTDIRDNQKKPLIWATFLIWFVPLLSVRFSSENYASLSFLAALILLVQNVKKGDSKNSSLLLAGLILGLSFYFRFQMAFAILGLGAWLLFIKRISLKKWMVIILGGLFAIGFNILIDYWFYGNWCFTPWNYFEANIMDNKAAGFGTSPWHAYITLFVGKAIPPISVLLLVFFTWGAVKNKMHLVLWCTVPFLLGHFLVGHKELRFLFPILILFIFLSVEGYKIVKQRTKQWRYNSFSWLVGLTIVVNTILLALVIFSPAQPSVKAYQFLYNYSQSKEYTILSSEESIYQLASLETNFYTAPKLENKVLQKGLSFSDHIKQNNPNEILVLQKKIDKQLNIPGYESKIIYCSVPKWLFNFNYNNWLSRSNVWQVVELKKLP